MLPRWEIFKVTKGKLAFFHSFIASLANYLLSPCSVLGPVPGARSPVMEMTLDVIRVEHTAVHSGLRLLTGLTRMFVSSNLQGESLTTHAKTALSLWHGVMAVTAHHSCHALLESSNRSLPHLEIKQMCEQWEGLGVGGIIELFYGLSATVPEPNL